jgi:hypothetical protein
MREAIIQGQIIKYLEANNWLAIKLIQTNKNGIPDLMALKDGRTVFIEVKKPGKKPNDLQKYRMDQLSKKGFDAITATSTHDVQNFFDLTVKIS